MIEHREREAMKLEASRIVHDPHVGAPGRAQALLLWSEAHYWRAREHLDAQPPSFLSKVLGRKLPRGYELDIDVYTRHWLAAVAPSIPGAADLVDVIGKQYGYRPERCAYLPPGRSMYADPRTLRESDRWPEPNMRPPRKGKAAQALRRGDVIRLKVPTMSGFKGVGVVTEDMVHPDGAVLFVRMGMDLREIPATVARHEVALIGELVDGGGCSMTANHLNLSAHWTDRTTRGWIEAGIIGARPLADYRKVWNIAAALPSIDRGCCTSERGARERLDTALRTIAFMDAAGLKGSRAWRSIFGGDAYGMHEGLHPSGFDHTEVWLWHGRYVITTEPYGTGDAAKAWCAANGWECAERPAWGVWNPPATTLLLCTPPKRGADLGAILKALDHATPIPFDERDTAGKVHVVERRSAA
jgi:hypothetical protein